MSAPSPGAATSNQQSNVQPKPAATTKNHESLLGGVHENHNFLIKEVVDEARVVKHGAVVSKMWSLVSKMERHGIQDGGPGVQDERHVVQDGSS